MSLHLTYPALIPSHELIGRLLGPDTMNAFVQITSSEQDIATSSTRVQCRPVPTQELAHMTRDNFGYYWLPITPTEPS